MEYLPILGMYYGKSDEARNIFKKVKQISSTTACYYEEVCLKYHSIDLMFFKIYEPLIETKGGKSTQITSLTQNLFICLMLSIRFIFLQI